MFFEADAALAMLPNQDLSATLPLGVEATSTEALLDAAIIAGAEAGEQDAAELFDVEPSMELVLIDSLQQTGSGPDWSDRNDNGYYDKGDTIVVTGYLFTEAYSGGAAGGSGGGGRLEGDVTSIEPIEATDTIPAAEPKDTPCVETAFATPGVDLKDVNRAALAGSNVIAGLNYTEVEYSSIIFVVDGKVGFTQPYTDNLEDEVNLLGGLQHVPSGAVIVGILHNQPDQINVLDTYPTEVDWAGYDEILNLSSSGELPRGITADANMLFYVFTNDTDQTHVYDKKDKNTKRTHCALQEPRNGS